MSSQTEICNRAIIRIAGANTISTIDEDSQEARLLTQIWDGVRKGLLRSHTWNFAIGLQQLAAIEGEPVFEYDFSYAIPSDCIKIVDVYNKSSEWKRRGNAIHTDMDSVQLIYVKDITDPTMFDPLFEECLVLKLAYELNTALAPNENRQAQLMSEFNMKFKEAKRADAQEDYATQWNNGYFIGSDRD